MFLHHVHGSLVMLYCALVWGAIGVLFSFGSLLFQKDWSLLRATLSHYLLMLLGFIPLATLAGWFPARLRFYLSLVVEFTLVYVIIWLVSHHFIKNKSKKSTKALLTTKRKDPRYYEDLLLNFFFNSATAIMTSMGVIL